MNITLILLLGIATCLKAQFCLRRFVGGKWITKGDCGNRKTVTDIARGIKVQEKEEVAHEICRNVKLEPDKSNNDSGGIFKYNVTGVGTIEVNCDMKTDGGDWIVLQRRVDGAVTFDRDWTDYVKGFGNLSRDFWLGLETVHQITNMGNHELRIDMIEKNGTYYGAKYSSFRIASSAENYTLYLDGYSGNATDALVNTSNNFVSANNQQFSARDVRHDHGLKGRNCAAYQGGGWWFRRCSRSNLNRNFTDLAWRDHSVTKDWLFLRFVEMKFRQT